MAEADTYSTTGVRLNGPACPECGCRVLAVSSASGEVACTHCGECNADLNGAINIAKKFERWMGYMPIHGAEREPALNQPKLEAPSVRVG
ncbi:MAG: zinc ribbon domain-containing protein [Candidatus Jordarchaeales archaeon]|nr:transposase [Candidatus Brockarchaeota archaeon]